ncbi:hypothetical protein A3F34_01560 [Candidatus Roizmanbacteria bacterium RIFCSPHIGHO2_12_FULL_44_10]|uniref:Uncharacterized protein n=1 Tax=Candidatus Roizmanbacteria bacterium RIFCSPHIGHO2_12_FULL_44_10 TaxID=1802054 RepID=A0A1F7I689_9BACT|nr:MAG: hypothetical protein A3F34_01560 [Candidatus Roizmanbacteria bacterium RIFCSPHIGHO2_12_FULL_44_10]
MSTERPSSISTEILNFRILPQVLEPPTELGEFDDTIYVRVPYSDHVTNLETPASASPKGINHEDKLHIALFVGHSELQAIHRMTDPWIASKTIAQELGDDVSPHDIRASLMKLVDLGLAEAKHGRGFRLRTSIEIMKSILLSTDEDTEVADGVDDTWDKPEIFPLQYAHLIESLVNLSDKKKAFSPFDDIDELKKSANIDTASGWKKIFEHMVAGKYPFLRRIRRGAYELANPDLAHEFVSRQNRKYVVVPELVHEDNRELNGNLESGSSFISYVPYSTHEVSFSTPDHPEPQTLSPDQLEGLAYFSALMTSKLRKMEFPSVSLAEIAEASDQSIDREGLRKLAILLEKSGLIKAVRRKRKGYISRVPLDNLTALAQGDDRFILSAPRDDLWDSQRFFHPTEVLIIHEVAKVIKDDKQFLTYQHAGAIAKRIGRTERHIKILLQTKLSRGPRSPFVRLTKKGRLAVYDIRESQLPTINAVSQSSQLQTSVLVLPDATIPESKLIRFEKESPVEDEFPPWSDYGLDVAPFPENPDPELLDDITALLEASQKRKRISAPSKDKPIYVGKIPQLDNKDIVTLLTYVGITSPEALENIIDNQHEQPNLLAILSHIEESDPENRWLLKVKKQLAQIALGEDLHEEELRGLTLDECLVLLSWLKEALTIDDFADEGQTMAEYTDQNSRHVAELQIKEFFPRLSRIIRIALRKEMKVALGSITSSGSTMPTNGVTPIMLFRHHRSLGLRHNQGRLDDRFWQTAESMGLATMNLVGTDDAHPHITLAGGLLAAVYWNPRVHNNVRNYAGNQRKQFDILARHIVPLIEERLLQESQQPTPNTENIEYYELIINQLQQALPSQNHH